MGRQINVISDQLAKELDLPQRTCRRLIQRLLEEIQDDIVNTCLLYTSDAADE